MKLLLCKECQDVFKLTKVLRTCSCGKSSGRYLEDNLHAEYSGDNALLLGFENSSIVHAVTTHDHTIGRGNRFNAFTIPDCSKNVKRLN